MMPTSHIEVRHPYVGEVPAELLTGFEAFRIDAEWQWVLVVDGRIKAQLLAANTHGLLMILRLTSLPDAPHGWALAMFRRVLADCKELGLIGYTTFLADSTKAERSLMRIAARQGAYFVPVTGAWVAGRMENGY